MSDSHLKVLVPPNYEGKSTDLTFSVTLDSRKAALDCYRRAAKRLLKPVLWHKLAGWTGARFDAYNARGQKLLRPIRVGDYLRIDIPGPGPVSGHGYDWVRVVLVGDHAEISGNEKWIGIQLRPCEEPGTRNKPIAHFFKASATSTFIIKRTGETVTSFYHGRNETPNTSTGNLIDNARNALVAAGAAAALSEAQWSALCKGLLNDKEPDVIKEG